MKYRGLQTNRLKREPEEKRFADAWSHQNEVYSLLAYLLHQGDQGGSAPMAEPSERDHAVAATCIQWLGSPVGQKFLEELGYTYAPSQCSAPTLEHPWTRRSKD